MNSKNFYLHLNSRNELLRIDVSKVVYFEADGNYTNIILMNKLKDVVCVNLGQIQKMLTERLKENAMFFARIGRKYIINHTFVYKINISKQRLILSDGNSFVFQIEVSKETLKRLKDLYTNVNNDKNK